MGIAKDVDNRNIKSLANYSADDIARFLNGYSYMTYERGTLFNDFRTAYPALWAEVESKMTNKKILSRLEKIRNGRLTDPLDYGISLRKKLYKGD